jgi:hypothetical protein
MKASRLNMPPSLVPRTESIKKARLIPFLQAWIRLTSLYVLYVCKLQSIQISSDLTELEGGALHFFWGTGYDPEWLIDYDLRKVTCRLVARFSLRSDRIAWKSSFTMRMTKAKSRTFTCHRLSDSLLSHEGAHLLLLVTSWLLYCKMEKLPKWIESIYFLRSNIFEFVPETSFFSFLLWRPHL